MYVHNRERDRRPEFDGVKIKFYYYLLFLLCQHQLITRNVIES